MQMGPYSPTRPTRMHPDQILSGLMPLVETYWRQMTAGANPGMVLQEAVLTGYLAGSGLSPAGATDLVRQWRQSGVSQLLAQETATPPAPTYTPAEWSPPPAPGRAPAPMAAPMPMAAVPTPTAASAPVAEPARLAITQEMLAPLLEEIRDFMLDEASAAAFYGQLLQDATKADATERSLDYIRHAMEDEQEHYRLLADLYRRLSGEVYAVEAQPVTYSDLMAGLQMAMDDEYDAFEEYREIYLGQRDQEIRDLFLLLMTDELEHATKFAYVLQELGMVS